MPVKARVLFLGKDDLWYQVLQEALGDRANLTRQNPEDIFSTIPQHKYALIVLDALDMPKEKTRTALEHLGEQQPQSKIVVASASPTWKGVREALKAGAADYIIKSFDPLQVEKCLASYL